VGNSILPVPFDNSVVEERCIFFTLNRPSLFDPLDVIGLFFGHKIVVLVMELLLQGVVLERRVQALLIENLAFNLSKEIIVLWCLPPPFPKICSKKLGFLREITSRGALPTLFGNFMIFLFH